MHVLIVGAGAAGLMAARELTRAGRQVTVLEAKDRCGGRIWPLPIEEFGYPAEGGAEFVHGAAPVTREIMREAGLLLAPRGGTRWRARDGQLVPDNRSTPYAGRFEMALREVETDLPIAEFLETRFAGEQYAELRRAITRTVEGYDAADPQRASTFAIRDEWLARDEGEHGRVAPGYGALINYLAAACRRCGAAIHLGMPVVAVDESGNRLAARCRDGASFAADAVIITVPPPLWSEIALPAATREQAAAAADIGFGNVVKILLRFATPWWCDVAGGRLADLSFVISDAAVPTWWTQSPAAHPVLTGWYAGPKADRVTALTEADLVRMGVASLAEIFGPSVEALDRGLVAVRAINWGIDPFARGAYSYATPATRAAQVALSRPTDCGVFFAGEALYAGPDMGTVEAALASGRDVAQRILSAD